MGGCYLYCQNTSCGVYLGSLGGDSCSICGWSAGAEDHQISDFDRLEAENKALRVELEASEATASNNFLAMEIVTNYLIEHDLLKITNDGLGEAAGRNIVDSIEAIRSRVVVVPEKLQAEPFTTIDKGCKNYKAGWNACLNELARLNGKTVSVELLRKWLELMEHGDFHEGHCMCGSAVDSHGIGDGHAPVDAGEYYAGQVMDELRALLDAWKEEGNGQ